MKVAVVNTTKTQGGAARAAVMLARAVSDYYDTVDIRVFHAENNEVDSFFAGFRKPLLNAINTLIARLQGSINVNDLGFVKQLKSHITDYDILHIHNIHGYYLNFCRLLEFWENRPIVWTWHDMWGATGRCAFPINCDLWEEGCSKCKHLDFYPAAWIDKASREFQIKEGLYKSTLSNAIIVTPSSWLRDIAIKRGFNQDRVVTIPNSVDFNTFKVMGKKTACDKTGLNPDKKYLLFIAADCNDIRKGYTDFSKIIRITGLDGIAVGLAPINAKAGILHTGTIQDDETICAYYSAADAVIIPAAADNYPNTTLEAMASGTPVIGYDTGGIQSQMPQWWEGTVKEGDYDGLSKRILKLMTAGGKTSELSALFRKYAEQTWHPNHIAKQYWEVYQRVIREYTTNDNAE